MNEHEFRELLKKYEKGNLSKEELSILLQFEKEMEQHSGAAFQNDRHRQKIKESIKKKLIFAKQREKFKVWRIAASVTLLFGLGIGAIYFSDSSEVPQIPYATKTTGWGEKRKLTLPDGSKVILNSGSSLSFPAQFANDSRTVKLEGEAFFDVVENAALPFIIHTNEVTTTVLGTSFNINTQDKEHISVTVATGKVRVASDHDNEVILTPKQQATYNPTTQTITTKEVSIKRYLDWKDGILRFDDVTIAEAALKLQQWYNVPIEVLDEDIANCRFSGKFNNEQLHTVLRSLANLKSGLEYVYVAGEKIQLKGTCN